MAADRTDDGARHDEGSRRSRARGLVFYLFAAALIALALPLGSGARTAAPAASKCGNSDNTWCLTVNLSGSGSGSVKVSDCRPNTTFSPAAAAATSCPSGWIDRVSPVTCTYSCDNVIWSGDKVILEPTASSGSHFSGWSGTYCSGTSSCTFTMPSEDDSETATFDLDQHTLTVNVVPSGAGTVTDGGAFSCSDSCNTSYTAGTKVSLTATANTGYRFSGWDGCDTTSGNTCNLTMDVDKRVTATFVRIFTLTIDVSGNGTVSYTGGSCSSHCTATFDAGTKVDLSEAPGGSDTFDGWGGDCTAAGKQTTCTLTMDADRSVKATFTGTKVSEVYPLVMSVDGDGELAESATGRKCVGTLALNCEVDLPKGTVVTVMATPHSGTNFLGFNGDCAGVEACTVVMDRERDVGATFKPYPVSTDLTRCATTFAPLANCEADAPPPTKSGLSVDVSGEGTVVEATRRAYAPASSQDQPSIKCGASGYDCYADYDTSATVVLKVRPAGGFSFQGWTGACSGTAPSCTVALSKARLVGAKFGPRGNRKVLSAAMNVRPFRATWRVSVGHGSAVLSGRVGKPARLVFELRRNTDAGALMRVIVNTSGSFRKKVALKFRGGAVLLPGAFVVSMRGHASGYYVPLQLKTVYARGPSEGVVRRSVPSRTGATTRRLGTPVKTFPGTARFAWANFRFAQQPAASLPVYVYAYWPDGRLLRMKRKANRLVISTNLNSGTFPGLGKWPGRWRIELRAGRGCGSYPAPSSCKLVKTQYLKIARL